MCNRKHPLTRLALIASGLLTSALAMAQQETTIGNVEWSSDGNSTMRTEGDFRILEMQDNVRVTQGTLVINGDEAVFEYDAATNELLKVTVIGTPVNYQQTAEDAQPVTGSSETIILYREVDTQETILEFIGDAVVISADSTMHCQAIVYLADQELIREATGPCQGTLNSSSN